MRLIFTGIMLVALTCQAQAKHLHPESWYQDSWCQRAKGTPEFVLADRTRCDCLTEEHAIEFEFGAKWHEAIGQSLYYSLQTGKRAGIVLILENISDRKYWIRLNSVIQHYNLPIDAWEIAGE